MTAPHDIARRLFGALAVAALAGCAVGPDYRAPRPDMPAAWNALAAPGSRDAGLAGSAPAAIDWWTSFNDPELTSLVTRAAAANLDAKGAVLRLAEARAQRRVAAAGLWPSLNGDASYTTTRVSETTPTGSVYRDVGKFPSLSGFSIPNPYDQYQLGFDAAWEVDLFGRVRRAREAAGADAEAALADAAAVRVAVLADVGAAYADLRGAQARRTQALALIAAQQRTAELLAQKRGAELASDADLARARADLTSVQAQLAPLDREIAEDVNQLSLLLALPPGALQAELAGASGTRPVPPTIPVGLPADLLRRRPDIREAEARLHAATARVGVAVGDLFPRVTLNAQGGYQSERLSTLTEWASRFITAGPAIELPVFDAGRRRASVRIADLRMREAALDYRKAVLGAVHEADNAIAAYRTEAERHQDLARTVDANAQALDAARRRHASGLASEIEVLSAEATLRQSASLADESAAALEADLVRLYRALGGGWRPEDFAAGVRRAGSG